MNSSANSCLNSVKNFVISPCVVASSALYAVNTYVSGTPLNPALAAQVLVAAYELNLHGHAASLFERIVEACSEIPLQPIKHNPADHSIAAFVASCAIIALYVPEQEHKIQAFLIAWSVLAFSLFTYVFGRVQQEQNYQRF